MTKIHRRFSTRGTLGVFFVSLIGPLLALFVTWHEVVELTSISSGKAPSQEVIERLRTTPNDSVLMEIRDFSVGGPVRLSDEQEILSKADEIIAEQFVIDGDSNVIGIAPSRHLDIFENASSEYRLSSLSVPSLLASAYEVSSDDKYLLAAVRYVLAWIEYESSLLIPRGYVFNDHSIIGRALTVTEIWRLYRSSKVFVPGDARELLLYVQKLRRLVMAPNLYSYKTNHGIMQSLAGLHLTIAFPLLDSTEANTQAAIERLLLQLQYYVSAEGVVLENSAGYHHNGLDKLAAAWRYLALHGRAVPAELAIRYEQALKFYAALRRPDGTLPVVGDTFDVSFTLPGRASLDGESIASKPVQVLQAREVIPPAAYIAPESGYAIVWDGLDDWPDSAVLSQTVLSWANFPTKVHKHADELSISLWARGVQWVRSVGYWPYEKSRVDAIGWRSSNGPHLLGESPELDRSSSLMGFFANDNVSFFDIVRKNANGLVVRRQLIKLEDRLWAVIDSFESQVDKEAEVVWRFSPSIELSQINAGHYLLHASGADQVMSLTFGGPDGWLADADITGEARWNSGVESDGAIRKSPAIRLSTTSEDPIVVSVFEMQESVGQKSTSGTLDLQWGVDNEWRLLVKDSDRAELVIQSAEGRLLITEPGGVRSSWEISSNFDPSAREDRRHAIETFESVVKRYGQTFKGHLERRAKVTFAIGFCAVIQFIIFMVVWSRRPALWTTLLVTSSAAWVGLSVFLGRYFLV